MWVVVVMVVGIVVVISMDDGDGTDLQDSQFSGRLICSLRGNWLDLGIDRPVYQQGNWLGLDNGRAELEHGRPGCGPSCTRGAKRSSRETCN